MGKSDYLENEILKWVTGQANALDDGIITPYIGLYTTLPVDAGTGGVEVSTSGTAYARVSLASKFGSPSAGSITNTVAVSFTTPTASWGTVIGVGIFTASTGGNLLKYGALAVSKVIDSGDPVSFAIGTITLRED